MSEPTNTPDTPVTPGLTEPSVSSSEETIKDEPPVEPVSPSEETVSDVEAGEPPAEPPPDAVSEPPAPAPSNKRWYVVKVTSGREETIKESIERKVKIDGLEEYFGRIIIPVEKVAEMRAGKRIVRERKLYPGYVMAEVEFNDQILYLFRDTSGVGDFVGGGLNITPQPMSAREVEQMLGRQGDTSTERSVTAKPKFDRGDRVKVKDGTFAGMEGEVKELLELKAAVRVELTIFGRPVPVELEYWQVELV